MQITDDMLNKAKLHNCQQTHFDGNGKCHWALSRSQLMANELSVGFGDKNCNRWANCGFPNEPRQANQLWGKQTAEPSLFCMKVVGWCGGGCWVECGMWQSWQQLRKFIQMTTSTGASSFQCRAVAFVKLHIRCFVVRSHLLLR